jgi:hypothetical protein
MFAMAIRRRGWPGGVPNPVILFLHTPAKTKLEVTTILPGISSKLR